MATRYVVEITATAERDVAEIATYIAARSPVAAKRWEIELTRQARTLARFPNRGVVIPEAERLGVGYRHLIFGDYRTIYRIDDTRVVVVRVLHGARLLRGISMG